MLQLSEQFVLDYDLVLLLVLLLLLMDTRGRFSKLEEIVDLVEFLAIHPAASYMTGQYHASSFADCSKEGTKHTLEDHPNISLNSLVVALYILTNM